MVLCYENWNNRLFKYFFNENMAYQEVIIYADAEVITRVGSPEGDVSAFLDTIKSWSGYTNRKSFCQRALSTYRAWENNPEKFSEPPYFAYLVFLIYAGTIEDQEGRSYYRKLNTLLDDLERDNHSPPSFNRMETLWEDLDRWTTQTCKGRIGKFTKVESHFVHVSNPISQSLLSEEDRKKLPNIFSWAAMSPDTLPLEEEVRRAMVDYNGPGGLSARIRRLLEKVGKNRSALSENENAAYILMMRLVFSDLVNWDGNKPLDLQGGLSSRVWICIREKGIFTSTGVRVRLQGDKYCSFYDIDRLSLKVGDQEIDLSCEGSPGHIGWSKRVNICRNNNKKMLDTLEFPSIWSEGATFIGDNGEFLARLRGGDIHIFRDGSVWSFDETWVEVNRLEKNHRLLIACRAEVSRNVEKWGRSCCRAFKERQILQSLTGWIFYEVDGVEKGNEDISGLSIPDFATSRLEGGLKLKDKNRHIKKYLQGGLPVLVLEGGDGDEVGVLRTENGDLVLQKMPGEGDRWLLPQDIPVGTLLRIEIGRYDEDGMFRKVAYSHTITVEPIKIKKTIHSVWRDSIGEVVDDKANNRSVINGYSIREAQERVD